MQQQTRYETFRFPKYVCKDSKITISLSTQAAPYVFPYLAQTIKSHRSLMRASVFRYAKTSFIRPNPVICRKYICNPLPFCRHISLLTGLLIHVIGHREVPNSWKHPYSC
jgi:hypothetical protein